MMVQLAVMLFLLTVLTALIAMSIESYRLIQISWILTGLFVLSIIGTFIWK